MTPQDQPAFAELYTSLLIALVPRDEQKAGVSVYFDALVDLPLTAVQQAAERFTREHGRKFLPATTEWHEAAADVEYQQLEREGMRELPAPLTPPEAADVQEKRARILRIFTEKATDPETSELARANILAAGEMFARLPLQRPWSWYCPRLTGGCNDTGFRDVWVWADVYQAKVRAVERCSCFFTNPELARERRKSERDAQAKAQERSRKA